jgi:hypothetical protein
MAVTVSCSLGHEWVPEMVLNVRSKSDECGPTLQPIPFLSIPYSILGHRMAQRFGEAVLQDELRGPGPNPL